METLKDPITGRPRGLLQADVWEALGYPKCMGCLRVVDPRNVSPSGFCWICVYSGAADRVLRQGWPNLSASPREIAPIIQRTKRIIRGKARGYKGVDQ